MSKMIGIDLGTTNSCVSILEGADDLPANLRSHIMESSDGLII